MHKLLVMLMLVSISEGLIFSSVGWRQRFPLSIRPSPSQMKGRKMFHQYKSNSDAMLQSAQSPRVMTVRMSMEPFQSFLASNEATHGSAEAMLLFWGSVTLGGIWVACVQLFATPKPGRTKMIDKTRSTRDFINALDIIDEGSAWISIDFSALGESFNSDSGGDGGDAGDS